MAKQRTIAGTGCGSGPTTGKRSFFPDSLPQCVRALLHPYLESDLKRQLSLEAFFGTQEEFFVNVEQFMNCRGHNPKPSYFARALGKQEGKSKGERTPWNRI